jgi:hypothetical protein
LTLPGRNENEPLGGLPAEMSIYFLLEVSEDDDAEEGGLSD